MAPVSLVFSTCPDLEEHSMSNKAFLCTENLHNLPVVDQVVCTFPHLGFLSHMENVTLDSMPPHTELEHQLVMTFFSTS